MLQYFPKSSFTAGKSFVCVNSDVSMLSQMFPCYLKSFDIFQNLKPLPESLVCNLRCSH